MIQINLKTSSVTVCFCLIALIGCGGPRINSKPQKLVDHGALSTVADQILELTLKNILVRNSPGSWAKDANWDEYIFSLKPIKFDADVIVQSVYIEDVMGDLHSNENTRKALNQTTKKLKKKYKKAGYKIEIGAGSTHASAVGISLALGTGVTAGAVTATGTIGTLTSVGVGVAVAVPALVISGVTKIVYNTRVNNRIQQRQTLPPVSISGERQLIDLLFPAIPIPQTLVVNYLYDDVPHQLKIDLTQVTTDLHIKK